MGRLEGYEDKLGEARIHFNESLDIFKKPGDYDELGILRSLLGFSWLSAKEGNWKKAVKLLGAEEALRKEKDRHRPPDWKDEMDFIVEGAHKNLDEATFAAMWAEGKEMTWEQAVENSLKIDAIRDGTSALA